MGAYKAAVVTDAGQALIASAISSGTAVIFSSAKTSSYAYPAGTNIAGLTDLQDIVQTVDPTSAQVFNDTMIQVSSRFDNSDVQTTYLIQTLGLYAQLGTDAPVLFAVIQATTPDQMEASDSASPSAIIFNVQITVQQASKITVTVNPAGTATVQDILNLQYVINDNMDIIDAKLKKQENHAVDKENPHSVTAEQAGALPLTGGTITGPIIRAMSGSGEVFRADGVTDGKYADLAVAYDGEGNRVGSVRAANYDGYNNIVLAAHDENNSAPAGLEIINKDGTLSIKFVGKALYGEHNKPTTDDISGTMPVSQGGTGATTLASGAALIGNGTGAVGTRSITNLTAKGTTSANTNLVTGNTVVYHSQMRMNRTTNVHAADTNYTSYMARGIALVTSVPSSIYNGGCAFVYS